MGERSIKQTRDESWQRVTELPLALVAIAFIALYSVQVLGHLGHAGRHILWMSSWVSWCLFVGDYLVRLKLASDKRHWFVHHPFDLLVVVLPLMGPLLLLRLAVLAGALQKAVGMAVRGRILTYTVTGVCLLIYVSSLAVLDFERDHLGARITSFGKALWWAVTTVTTVGYGDLYPVTVPGRLVAVMLMIGGITLVGVVTASLASWIVERVSETDTANRATSSAEIAELRHEVRRLAEQLRRVAEHAELESQRSLTATGGAGRWSSRR
ncbi:potassium channel family protein [Mycobacterium helveticum]|uniref:Two pore domain potassium channel family protein n=1 Tax=Mycobacterium helveticum TaxID=2592811 RepID=A0A557XWU3_9MYCO|nr:potassium channel family protein [Mycobacterium helveticum]TVS88097.1 two pore domain potassium channel family protein [Mycobacterium helveticum]TVS90544.1 two pore domain potassium channel family protein [Mycobacterium helveticum]